MAFLIGDTIRLGAVIRNLDGDEQVPAAITLTIYRSDGTTKLLDAGIPTKKTGRISEYYYDWTISELLASAETLIAVWGWTGPHKKKITFDVETNSLT